MSSSLHLAEFELKPEVIPGQKTLNEIGLILDQFEINSEMTEDERYRLANEAEDCFTELANLIDEGKLNKKEFNHIATLCSRIVEAKIPITLRIAYYLVRISSAVKSRLKTKAILKSVK